ncbi:hypothetical protein PAAL66ix_15492 [Paenibacillus alvei A6-6i-x]|nr:hypothetical protein PAAL66ix_15492 [Paenibacillus alvei A6-6i-x]
MAQSWILIKPRLGLGASRNYILIVQNNAPALHLYQKLQYKEAYRYWYRLRGTH